MQLQTKRLYPNQIMLVTRNLHKYMMDQVGMIDEINTHPRELQKSQQEMKSGSLYEFSDYIHLTENATFFFY